jgi:hypothetical protein
MQEYLGLGFPASPGNLVPFDAIIATIPAMLLESLQVQQRWRACCVAAMQSYFDFASQPPDICPTIIISNQHTDMLTVCLPCRDTLD